MRFVKNFAVRPLRYRDPRRDQRLLLPELRVEIAGLVLATTNWSLSGALLRGELPIGAALDRPVSGIIGGVTRNGPAQVPFTGIVVRLELSPPGFALRFATPDPRLMEFLHDCLLRHLAGPAGCR